MTGLAAAGAAAAGYAGLAVWASRRFRPDPPPRSHRVETADGWPLSVAEYPARGDSKGTVFLQHGLGGSALNFDLHPHGPSLARWLSSRGWRVFAADLRGRGPAGLPSGKRRDWRFSDYVLHDVPAAAAFVRARAGGDFHWIGHSLGGILGLVHTARAGGVRSLTTLGSALHYGVGASAFKGLLPFRAVLERLPLLPTGLIHMFWGPLAGARLFTSPWHYRAANMTRSSILSYHAFGQTDITIPELVELGSTFEGEGILCAGLGKRLPELAARIEAPWLAFAAGRDLQCPPVTARWTFDRVAAPRKDWVLCSADEGFALDYGHYDLIGGVHAPAEVWPRIEDFLLAA